VHLLIKEIALFMGLLIVQLESRRLKVISCFESQTYIIFRQCVHDSTLWIFFFFVCSLQLSPPTLSGKDFARIVSNRNEKLRSFAESSTSLTPDAFDSWLVALDHTN
jgi:hypothetical protein